MFEQKPPYTLNLSKHIYSLPTVQAATSSIKREASCIIEEHDKTMRVIITPNEDDAAFLGSFCSTLFLTFFDTWKK